MSFNSMRQLRTAGPSGQHLIIISARCVTRYFTLYHAFMNLQLCHALSPSRLIGISFSLCPRYNFLRLLELVWFDVLITSCEDQKYVTFLTADEVVPRTKKVQFPPFPTTPAANEQMEITKRSLVTELNTIAQ